MNKYPLIGISIIAVVFLILTSLTNVVGYQAVQTSNQNIVKEEVNQKDLVFQTIVDIMNNKEIQRIILTSQISRGKFFNPDVRFSIFKNPVVTKNQLKNIYLVGLMLSKVISKSRIHSMIESYRMNNQGMQKEISTVIKKDTTLNAELAQLLNSKCDCENEKTTSWNFPIICILHAPFVIIAWYLYFLGGDSLFGNIVFAIGGVLNCFWL
jgi:hypothetical protein